MSSTRCLLAVLLILVVSTSGLESTVSSSIQFASAENSTTVTERSTTVSSSVVGSETGPDRWEKGSRSKDPWRRYERRGASDSYLSALKHSRTTPANRREYVPGRAEGPVYVTSAEYGKPVVKAAAGQTKSSRVDYGSYDSTRQGGFSFEQAETFHLPDRTRVDFREDGPPNNSYGPPKNVYGPPAKNYQQNPYGEYSLGSYSPAGQGYGYGPTPYGHSEPSHVIELPSIGFGWPFALKLNAYTIAKIILKLVIFKMIVKFIAVICLLLFIPKLEIKKRKKGSHSNDDDEDDEEDESRSNSAGFPMSTGRLNGLTSVVLSAVEKYEAAFNESTRSADDFAATEIRSSIGRWVTRVLGPWTEGYVRLLESYVFEEMRFPKEAS